MVIVSEMLANIIADNILAQRNRMNINVIVGRGVIALSFSFFIIGSGFCIYASYLWLSAKYSYLLAVYFTGAISLLIAFLVGVIVLIGMKYRQRRIKKMHDDILSKVQEITNYFDNEFGASIRENPKLSVLIATVSGFFIQDLRR